MSPQAPKVNPDEDFETQGGSQEEIEVTEIIERIDKLDKLAAGLDDRLGKVESLLADVVETLNADLPDGDDR